MSNTVTVRTSHGVLLAAETDTPVFTGKYVFTGSVPTATSTPKSTGSNSGSTAAIIAGSVGALVGLILLITVIFLLWRRKHKKAAQNSTGPFYQEKSQSSPYISRSTIALTTSTSPTLRGSSRALSEKELPLTPPSDHSPWYGPNEENSTGTQGQEMAGATSRPSFNGTRELLGTGSWRESTASRGSGPRGMSTGSAGERITRFPGADSWTNIGLDEKPTGPRPWADDDEKEIGGSWNSRNSVDTMVNSQRYSAADSRNSYATMSTPPTKPAPLFSRSRGSVQSVRRQSGQSIRRNFHSPLPPIGSPSSSFHIDYDDYADPDMSRSEHQPRGYTSPDMSRSDAPHFYSPDMSRSEAQWSPATTANPLAGLIPPPRLHTDLPSDSPTNQTPETPYPETPFSDPETPYPQTSNPLAGLHPPPKYPGSEAAGPSNTRGISLYQDEHHANPFADSSAAKPEQVQAQDQDQRRGISLYQDERESNPFEAPPMPAMPDLATIKQMENKRGYNDESPVSPLGGGERGQEQRGRLGP